jgi:hypothetical protein
MEKENQQRFDADQPAKFRIQRRQKGRGGPVEACVPGLQERRFEQRRNIPQGDDHPEKAGQNAVELKVFPDGVFSLEVKIKRFIIRAVPHVVAQMSLAEKMERGGKEQRQHDAGDLVYFAMGVKEIVLRLVEKRVSGIHCDGVAHGESHQLPSTFDFSREPQE